MSYDLMEKMDQGHKTHKVMKTLARQAPLFMGFFWQKYWSGLPFPSPGDIPDPRIESGSPALHTDYLTSESLPEISTGKIGRF